MGAGPGVGASWHSRPDQGPDYGAGASWHVHKLKREAGNAALRVGRSSWAPCKCPPFLSSSPPLSLPNTEYSVLDHPARAVPLA